MKTTERNSHLDRLAQGVNCHRCGVTSDEQCRTSRGASTFPHSARIDRAVALYLKAKKAS